MQNNLLEKYAGNELAYVAEYLKYDKNMKGPSWTQKLESLFCEKMGVRYAIACNSGTSGLHMAVAACDIEANDEVIIPALTVVMDPYVVMHQGGVPVFVDVHPKTYTIDPEKIEEKISKKTKAIITVSLQGLPVDMDPIREIADRHNLLIIEDSAQTMLGKYKGKMAGTLGDINVFSFENKKHMTSGSEGGMVVTNNEKLAERSRKFGGIGYRHLTAMAGRTSLALSFVQDPDYARFDTVGLNYRLSEIAAAVGLAQFERIEALINQRRRVAKLFSDAVRGAKYFIEQATPADYEHSYYTFAVEYLGANETGISWKSFYNYYIEMGGDGFYAPCLVPYLEPALKGKPGLCPVAEELQKRIMQFKTNYRDLETAKRKADILNQLINKLGL